MIYTGVSLIAAFLLGTILEYARQKAYYMQLETLTENLSRKYLLPEMMDTGKRQEERLLYEIIRAIGKSMNENVADAKRNSREYKEYIEMWIHEVKMPIAAARMILENHTGSSPDLHEEIDRLERYVEQALFYSRSTDVQKDYLINKITLKKVVEEALLQRKRELIGGHVSLNLHDLAMEVYSDGKWMEFIIGQVLDNSIKYAVKERFALEIFGEEAQEGVYLYIRDNGIGVKEEEISRVFDKGFTGTSGRRYKKSTGIGLYLCKKLCNRLGHNILFSSVEGEGSQVIFVFPKSTFIDEVR